MKTKKKKDAFLKPGSLYRPSKKSWAFMQSIYCGAIDPVASFKYNEYRDFFRASYWANIDSIGILMFIKKLRLREDGNIYPIFLDQKGRYICLGGVYDDSCFDEVREE